MKIIYFYKILNLIFRINLFIFSYLLYLFQILFIFLHFKKLSKTIFKYSAYFCSLSLGIFYDIDDVFKLYFTYKGIHIANHDNPLDIFIAQYLFAIRTITTVDQHLKSFLPFFEISLKNYGHYCFDFKSFNERKLAYLFLKRVCKKDKNILIYPSGSIYTSILKRFSKSVSKLSISNHTKVIAWKFSYFDQSNIEYNRDISKYIFERFFAEKIIIRIEKIKVFNPSDYLNCEKLHEDLQKFYSIS